MKKITLIRLGALAVVVCIAMALLLSGTLAKYTSQVTGGGKASVAAWSFKANGGAATMTNVALTDATLNSKVASGKIAPGTDGQFDITIDGSGSETAIDYTIAFSNLVNKPTNLKFYSDAGFEHEIVALIGYTGLNGNIALANVGTVVTKTVYWKWAYETTDGDTADTTDQDKEMTFDITVTGTQQNPTEQNQAT